jgi:hypothetical protein
MQTTQERDVHDAPLAHQLNDIGWGLLLILTGALWLFPSNAVPAGTWLFGVAAILLGVSLARYLKHIRVNRFTVFMGIAALVAAVSQTWRSDPPLVAIFLLAIGLSLIAKPVLTRTA